jgi:hypothetical protein
MLHSAMLHVFAKLAAALAAAAMCELLYHVHCSVLLVVCKTNHIHLHACCYNFAVHVHTPTHISWSF